MLGVSKRFIVLAAGLVAVNIVGWVWVRYAWDRGGRPRVRVLSVSPGSGESAADAVDRFTLRFDDEVGPSEGLGEAAVKSPFVVTPQPPGHWVWEQRDRLSYVLDEKLPAGRRWVVEAAPDCATELGRELVGESRFTFATSRLELMGCDLVASDRTHASVELRFNQPVDPEELVRHVKLTDGKTGDAVRFESLVREPSPLIVLRVERASGDGAASVRVAIEPGLAGHEAELGIEQPVRRTVAIDEAFNLVRSYVPTPGDGDDIDVTLRFTAELDRKQAAPALTVTPAVEGMRTTMSGGQIVLGGPFRCGIRYKATVPATLVDAKGRTLGEEQSVSFTVPDREPTLRFPLSRGYLMPGGNLAVDMRVVNVAGAKVSAWRVHENNLIAHLRGEGTGDTARRLMEREVPLDGPRNEVRTIAVDLARLVRENGPGVYEVAARASDRYWAGDSIVVAVTDLALTTKRTRDGYVAWVTSLSTAAPVEGATVRVMSRTDQVLGEAVTGPDGLARIAVPDEHPDGPAWAITAKVGGDLTYVRTDHRPWSIAGVDQSGRPHTTTYDVMAYAERGVYRPGDTVHLSGVIRDRDGGVPQAMPLTVNVYRPDGKLDAEVYVPPSDLGQGVFQVDIVTREDGQLGRYRFDVCLPGTTDAIGSTGALVEAFVPVRIEVKAAADAERYGPDQAPSLSVDARYLFGQPASQLPVTVSGYLEPATYRSKRHADYQFTGRGDARTIRGEEKALSLDDTGKATIDLGKGIAKDGPVSLYRGRFTTTVSEVGGRSVSKQVGFEIDTADRHVGLRLPGARFVPSGEAATIGWARVNGADEPVGGGVVRFTLTRVDSDWVLEDVRGQMVWRTIVRETRVTQVELGDADTAAGELPIRCDASGRYRLDAVDVASGSATRVEFYACRGAGEYESLSVDQPERVEVLLDRASYRPGETASVVLRSPFVGTVLLTVETDQVVTQRVLSMLKNTVRIDLPVDESIRGGAFVTVTAVRAIDPTKDRWLPHRAIGMARLVTDHGDRRADVSIDAPADARPGDTVSVKVNVGASPAADPLRPGVVHVWAVDDGILLTTSYPTPDPMAHFMAPRRLGVISTDTFGDLLPDHARPTDMSRIGADGDEFDSKDGMALRRSPVSTRRREPAVVWSAFAAVGADGSVTLDMPMPQISGRMRLMAVAVDGDRYGSASRDVVLAAPLMVEAAWPRFVAPGDAFDVPVKLFNTTDSPITVSVTGRVDGPVRIEDGGQPITVTIEPGRPATVWIKATAGDRIGPVTAYVEVSQIGDVASAPGATGAPLFAMATHELVVRPTAPLHAESKIVRLEAGERLTLEPDASIEAAVARVKLRISGEPGVTLGPAVERLLDYPYGCVEQSTSRLFAILHAPELIESGEAGGATAHAARQMVNAGIARLWSMQTRSGGLGYWPGDTRPMLWGSAYAGELLMRARRAGFEVDDRFVKDLCDYLESQLGDRGIDDNMRAMIVHVLCGFGRSQVGWAARLTEAKDSLDIAGRSHVAAAWIEMGRRDRAAELIDEAMLNRRIATTTSARLTSQVAQEAALLNVLIDMDPQHPLIGEVVRRLDAARSKGYWNSTLDNAQALCALSRYLRLDRPKPDFTGVVRLPGDDRRAAERSFDHTAAMSMSVDRASGPIEIDTKGRGTVFVSATTVGPMRADLVKAYDHGLRVRRAWVDRAGKPIDPAKLHVGELVIVEMTLAAPELAAGDRVDNVAIVDALPGGLEIENPRLDTSERPGGTNGASADRVEFMDDRVVVFASATREPRVFRYALRVVSVGRFAWPAAQASCMYDDQIASVSGGGAVEVMR